MKAAVIGAGIAGLAMAQRLDAHGWDVTVVEQMPGPREQGYMIDFFGLGYDAAEAMGVLPRLKELGYDVDEWVYLDENGDQRAGMSFGSFAEVVNGRLFSIIRPDLELALREIVEDRVDLRYALSITEIESSSSGVRVTLTDGSVLDADLLVGADGIHSQVRRMVFGEEEQFFRYLGFHTAAYVFDDPTIHAELGNRFCLTDTMQRQMGFYGLRDDRVAAFGVHRSSDPTRPDDAQAAVRREYASLGWVVPSALERVPPRGEVYYDQVAQVEVPQWSEGRVVLVGDACQAVSLLAGQGASLAVAGAYVLGEHLARAETVEDALERYQRAWQPVVADKQAVGRRGAQWFLPATPLQLWVRRMMMRASRLPVLTRFVGRQLVGKSGAIGLETESAVGEQHGIARGTGSPSG